MTTPEAVEAALAAGVDAIGFVFAKSVRRVEPAAARALAAPARGRVACVAVTQHPEARALAEILATFEPDLLQTDAPDLAALAPGTVRCEVLPVVRAGTEPPVPLPARLLFEGPVSGTGETADWTRARELAGRTRLVLAGGLNAANVATAIGCVRPHGVDVSSGVEAAPGRKSPAKILEFVEAARAAFRELQR
ncbi:MAG: phosphoribosylanthranilate isomerase [Steroidobacteraceae bacterium]|nr:phosphoribosylanthranilate isomerase [Steroidobacteraceae bacterium]